MLFPAESPNAEHRYCFQKHWELDGMSNPWNPCDTTLHHVTHRDPTRRKSTEARSRSFTSRTLTPCLIYNPSMLDSMDSTATHCTFGVLGDNSTRNISFKYKQFGAYSGGCLSRAPYLQIHILHCRDLFTFEDIKWCKRFLSLLGSWYW